MTGEFRIANPTFAVTGLIVILAANFISCSSKRATDFDGASRHRPGIDPCGNGHAGDKFPVSPGPDGHPGKCRPQLRVRILPEGGQCPFAERQGAACAQPASSLRLLMTIA